MVTKQISQMQDDGTVITLDIGADAENVTTDADHQFVTAAEKTAMETGAESAKSADDKIGATGDTGGSSTAGSVMGKLNKIISDLATHMSRWTSARAGYIDNIKSDVAENKTTVTAIKTSTDKIGATGDTGGSSTAGSVMGKLNKIISDLATHMSRWTSARAGYIDSINTYTATNNTASATGTISQKLSHVINLLGTKGSVKSVQRGSVKFTGKVTKVDSAGEASQLTAIPDAVVTISAVDPGKCMVLLDGTAGNAPTASSSYSPSEAYVSGLSSNQLTLTLSDPELPAHGSAYEGYDDNPRVGNILVMKQSIGWQLIEFY